MEDFTPMAPEQVENNVWNLTPPDGDCYLVIGGKQALLIDTGFGDVDVKAEAEKLTSLPITLVNTHYHGDHISRDGDFPQVYANPRDWEQIKKVNPNLLPAVEGQIFDLGGRKLEVIELPGHTPGSIGLLDRENGLLFGGDTVTASTVFMQGDDASLEDFIKSQDKVIALEDEAPKIYGCHGDVPVTADCARSLKLLAVRVRDGAAEGKPFIMEFPDGRTENLMIFAGNGVSMYRKA